MINLFYFYFEKNAVFFLCNLFIFSIPIIQLDRNLNSSISFVWLSLAIPFALFIFCNVDAQQVHQPLAAENITLHDPNLKIELVASGLDFPTTMAFWLQMTF